MGFEQVYKKVLPHILGVRSQLQQAHPLYATQPQDINVLPQQLINSETEQLGTLPNLLSGGKSANLHGIY